MLEIWVAAGHNGEKRELIPSKTWRLSSLQKTSGCLNKSSIRAVGCRSWSCTRWRDSPECSPVTAPCATAFSDSESNRVWPSGQAAKVSSLWTRRCHFYSHWVLFSSLTGLTSQPTTPTWVLLSGFPKLCWWVFRGIILLTAECTGTLSSFLVARLLSTGWGGARRACETIKACEAHLCYSNWLVCDNRV